MHPQFAYKDEPPIDTIKEINPIPIILPIDKKVYESDGNKQEFVIKLTREQRIEAVANKKRKEYSRKLLQELSARNQIMFLKDIKTG